MINQKSEFVAANQSAEQTKNPQNRVVPNNLPGLFDNAFKHSKNYTIDKEWKMCYSYNINIVERSLYAKENLSMGRDGVRLLGVRRAGRINMRGLSFELAGA